MLRLSAREVSARDNGRISMVAGTSSGHLHIDLLFEISPEQVSPPTAVSPYGAEKRLSAFVKPGGSWWPVLAAASVAIEALRPPRVGASPPGQWPKAEAGPSTRALTDELPNAVHVTPGPLLDVIVHALRTTRDWKASDGAFGAIGEGRQSAAPAQGARAPPAPPPRGWPPHSGPQPRAGAPDTYAHSAEMQLMSALAGHHSRPIAQAPAAAPPPHPMYAPPQTGAQHVPKVQKVYEIIRNQIAKGMCPPHWGDRKPSEVKRQRNFVRSASGYNNLLTDSEVDAVIALLCA